MLINSMTYFYMSIETCISDKVIVINCSVENMFPYILRVKFPVLFTSRIYPVLCTFRLGKTIVSILKPCFPLISENT